MSKFPWVEGKSELTKEAVRRSPQYRREYEAAYKSYLESLSGPDQAASPSGFLFSNQAAALAARWNLTLAFHPDDDLWDVPRGHVPALLQHPGEAVKVIGRAALIPETDEESRLDITARLRDGRYLTVEIDLSQTQDQIIEELKYHIRLYRQAIEKPMVRGPSLDSYFSPEPPGGPALWLSLS